MHAHTILRSNGQAMHEPKKGWAQNRVKFGKSTENVIFRRIQDSVACMAIQFSDQTERRCKSQKRVRLKIT